MAGRLEWVKPKFSKGEINRAGQVLVSDDESKMERDEAFSIMNNWRVSHSFPLNTFQIYLRRKALSISSDALIAQRLKRAPSIVSKLERFPTMKLARMQDLGGCRAIMPTIEDVFRLREFYRRSDIKHKLADEKNYIQFPKESGYRGIHLVYKYFSDRNDIYNGLQIEIQIRTQLQHSWATAVETAGTFTNQALKSSQGSEKWLRFFALAGEAFARREGFPGVPGVPEDNNEFLEELSGLSDELRVTQVLRHYRDAVIRIEESGIRRGSSKQDQYFLIHLRPEEGILSIIAFAGNDLESVSNVYLDYERRASEGSEVVALVSASSMEALKAAYPNYFLDTENFIKNLESVLQ